MNIWSCGLIPMDHETSVALIWLRLTGLKLGRGLVAKLTSCWWDWRDRLLGHRILLGWQAWVPGAESPVRWWAKQDGLVGWMRDGVGLAIVDGPKGVLHLPKAEAVVH